MDPRITPGEQQDFLRLLSHLPVGNDQTLTILKGHLLIEELVREMIDSKLKVPLSHSKIRFEFDQCLVIAKSLSGDKFEDWVWQAMRKLNKLRNDLAHNLEPKGFNDRVTDFISFIESNREVNIGRESTFGPLQWAIVSLYIKFSVGLRYKPQLLSMPALANLPLPDRPNP
jgi:hypothetical protein